MSRCSAIKPNGKRCKVSVPPGVEYCWAHDPANSEARRRITSKAGRSRPNRETERIKTELAKLYADTMAKRVDKGVAAVGAQIQNVRLRAVEVERKIREQEELEERMSAVEEQLPDNRGFQNRWQR
jgi:hypothetical protein